MSTTHSMRRQTTQYWILPLGNWRGKKKMHSSHAQFLVGKILHHSNSHHSYEDASHLQVIGLRWKQAEDIPPLFFLYHCSRSLYVSSALPSRLNCALLYWQAEWSQCKSNFKFTYTEGHANVALKREIMGENLCVFHLALQQ